MNDSVNQKKEGRAANLSADQRIGSADERREGNHRLPSRIVKKATSHKPSHELAERWFVIDAKGQVVGRLAVKVAKLLMGKDNATFNRAVDAKTNVVIVNAEQVTLTGNKLTNKIYIRHTGYPGGIKTTTPSRLLSGKQSIEVVRHAVAGMLPKNKLHAKALDRLKIYAGPDHRHAGQNPVEVKL